MARWLRRLLAVSPYLASGLVLSLVVAWGLPLVLATRGFGPVDAPLLLWHREPGLGPWTDAAPMMTVRRSVFSDWFIAEPAPSIAPGRFGWPAGVLEDSNGIARRAPSAVLAQPPEGESAIWARLDTGLAGWPFRCFASEAWFARRADGDLEPVPEFRWNAHLGRIDGLHALVPLRPIAVGLVLDVLFWATVSWCAVAGPREFRRRRREKYGRCAACGYAMDPHVVQRPTRCPECGAPFAQDPLGFAHVPEMHFQNHYAWLLLVSSLDIMLTWKILERGGLEVNPVARMVIDSWGMHGAIAFKFALMMWVIVTCEALARVRPRVGRLLALAAVLLSAAPVVWSLVLLSLHALRSGGPH